MHIELKTARERGDWTLKEVADASGIALSTLWRIENGRITNPSHDTVTTLEETLIDGKRLIRRGEHLVFGHEAVSA